MAWHNGRTSAFGRRTFPFLRSSCSWWMTTYVGQPSATGQLTRPTQPFILSRSINWLAVIGCLLLARVAPSGECLQNEGMICAVMQLANTPPLQSTTPGLHPVSIHQTAPLTTAAVQWKPLTANARFARFSQCRSLNRSRTKHGIWYVSGLHGLSQTLIHCLHIPLQFRQCCNLH